MAYLSPDVPLPALEAPLNNSLFYDLSVWKRVALILRLPAQFLRRRWVYHVTVSRLQGYSERQLKDLGAAHGIEEFARRAAGL